MADIYYGIEFGGHKATVLRSTSPLPSSDVEVRLTYDANLNSKLKALQAMARLCGKIVESDFPPVVEDAGPAPILLDTFTAADGTDPTTRDMDTFLAGQARWEQSGASSVGDIQSNAFGPSGTSGGSWTDALITYALPSAAPVMGNAYPFAVVLRGVRRYANSCRAYAYIDGPGYDAIDLLWTTDTLQAELTADNGSGGWDDVTVTYSLTQGDGASHNFALWTDGSVLHLLLNGADVGQQSYSIGDILPSRLDIEIIGSGTPDAELRDQIASFGYYEGLTLSQALALTA